MAKKSKKDKALKEPQTVEVVMADIRKKFGKAAIATASDAHYLKVNRIRAEIPSLDFELGGGFPIGRIIHIYGRKHSGKTYLSLKMAALFQKRFPDKLVFWGDLERVFDPARAVAVGVDLDRIIVCQPTSAENGFDEAIAFAEQGHVSLVVYDSLAAVSAMAETEAGTGEQQMGMAPRIINKFFRKWLAATAPTSLDFVAPTLILTNQKREKICGYMPGETTPGGRGPGFFASIELAVSHGDKITLKEDDASGEPIIIGHDVNFIVDKNNTFPLGKKGSFILCTRPFQLEGYKVEAHGIDWPHSLLHYAVFYGVVDKNGNTYAYGENRMGVGRGAAQAFLVAVPHMAEEIYSETIKRVRAANGAKEDEEELGKARKKNSFKKLRKTGGG